MTSSTSKKIDMKKTRDKGHDTIHGTIGWLFVLVVWIGAFFSGIVKAFITHGKMLSGAFLMVTSALICIDNYYIIFTKESIANYWDGGEVTLNPFSIIMGCWNLITQLDPFFLTVSVLTWVLVEYVQFEALKAKQSARETSQVVGMPTKKGIMIMGLVATILEGISLVFGLWQRGGLSFLSIIVAANGLFGFKIGHEWLDKKGGN